MVGGVTTVFEMPNTRPATTSAETLADKVARARRSAHCDFAFYVGATAANATTLGELEGLEGCAGVKVFMGSSTGDLLVADDGTLEEVLRSTRRRVLGPCRGRRSGCESARPSPPRATRRPMPSGAMRRLRSVPSDGS